MNRREFIHSTGMRLVWLVVPVSSKSAVRTNTIALEAAEGSARLIPLEGIDTAVWQYNQQTPGPVIRIKQGNTLRVPFTNKLSQPTTVHWHGLRIANHMDGVPGMTQPLIQPGEQFLYEFTPPDAGTFWYHTHNRSWEQLARGLHGVLVVEENEPIEVDQDLVWVIDDWLLDRQGKIEESNLGALHDWAHGGRMGNTLTVNGQSAPEFPVRKGERIRLRLVNVANSRIMELRFKNAEPRAIAVDGQPIEPIVLQKNSLTIAPGQRTDLILDMTLDPGQRVDMEFIAGDKSMVAASLMYDAEKVAREQLLETPIRLPENPLPVDFNLEQGTRIELSMEGGAMGRLREAEYQGRKLGIKELIKEKKIWALNGVAGLSDKPLFSVKRGQTVSILIDNNNRWPHAMHVHGHHFKFADGKGNLSPLWRDTVLVNGSDKEHIAFVADNPGKWLIHCHMIEHQAGGMVTWFEVV